MPNLIEIQKDSYQWFLDEGLKEAFADISPIADFAGHLSLEFVDFTLCRDDIKYTIEERRDPPGQCGCTADHAGRCQSGG